MRNRTPEVMRRVAHAPGGGPEVLRLEEAPVPRPESGEILVRVFYAGVNRPDILQRSGRYPPPPDASPFLGLEVAGRVEAVGPLCRRFAPGDAVCALVPGGGYAEYCRAPEVHALPVPEGLGFAEAAALPETHFTVWAMLFGQGRLRPGETLLVHGGTSGIGLTALDLAHAFGARVAVTVGSEEKARVCLARGARLAVVRAREPFPEALAAAGMTPDVVLDIAGGETTARNLEVLGRDGRLVQVGTLAGAQATIPLGAILSKRLTIVGSTMRGRTREEKALLARELEDRVWPLYARGLRPLVAATFPLERVGDAHRLMESGAHAGKILLAVGPDAAS
jgi:NADPH2:quinone reductase